METCSLQKAIETLKKEGYGYRVSGDLLYFNKKGCHEIQVREEFGGGCVFTTNRWTYHDSYEAMMESGRKLKTLSEGENNNGR